MELIKNNIEKLNNNLKENPSVENAIITCLRNYSGYLLGLSLNEAILISKAFYEVNPSSVELLLINSFFNIEKNNKIGGDYLNSFKPYRNFYKNNDLIYYIYYILME